VGAKSQKELKAWLIYVVVKVLKIHRRNNQAREIDFGD
jgi:hypothetical protein